MFRVLGFAALCGARDFAAIYTWRSWLSGWFLRVLCQVSFFALVGRLLESERQTWFLLVGNAVLLAGMQGVWALNMVAWERDAGTLPFIAASPTSPVVVLTFRGSYLILDGTASALGALFVLAPVFDLPLAWPRALLLVPLTLLVASSAYCLGTFLGAVVLGYRRLNSILANVGLVTLMVLCGVNVPLAVYPPAVGALSQALPLTHGLLAIRAVLDGDLGYATARAAAEAAVGACWLAAAMAVFAAFVNRGRRTGTLDYGA